MSTVLHNLTLYTYFVAVPTNYIFINKKKDMLCWVIRKAVREKQQQKTEQRWRIKSGVWFLLQI